MSSVKDNDYWMGCVGIPGGRAIVNMELISLSAMDYVNVLL